MKQFLEIFNMLNGKCKIIFRFVNMVIFKYIWIFIYDIHSFMIQSHLKGNKLRPGSHFWVKDTNVLIYIVINQISHLTRSISSSYHITRYSVNIIYFHKQTLINLGTFLCLNIKKKTSFNNFEWILITTLFSSLILNSTKKHNFESTVNFRVRLHKVESFKFLQWIMLCHVTHYL